MEPSRKINFIDNCIHSKNIGSILEMKHSDPQFKTLNDHLAICSICTKKLETIKEKNLKLQVFIPRPVMDKETKENFDHEIHELLKSFGLNDKVSKHRKMIKSIKNANTLGEVILKTFFSRNVLISLGLGLGVALAFNYLH